MATFDRKQLLLALTQLIDALASDRIAARIRIVGGAAVVLLTILDEGRPEMSTRSWRILAISVVGGAAHRGTFGPADGRLNTDAQMYCPDPDHPEPAWELVIERDGVIVEVGTARLLLAMKLHAARGLRDTDDIEVLVSLCGLRSVEETIELYEAHYRADPLPERARAKLRQLCE